MGIALFTFDGLFAPLQAAFDWLAGAAQARSRPSCAVHTTDPAALRSVRPALPPGRAGVHRVRAVPVRVLRVVDAHAPATAGRMVISGRMADVCAELDRMAGQAPLARRSPRRANGASPR